MLDLGLWGIAWCAFALAGGGLIKGTLGVGTPLLTVPLMALVLPPQAAIALMAIPVVVANLWQFHQAERSADVVRRFWPAFTAILVGTWIGVKILAVINEQALLLLVGILVISFTILQGSTYKLHIPDRMVKPAGALFGLASGLIGGISSMFGPMLIIYLISVRGLSKERFVSSISFLYVSAVIPWSVVLYIYGILDNQLLLMSCLATIPVSLGLWLGQSLRRRVSESHFQRLVLMILLASGSTMIWRAFN